MHWVDLGESFPTHIYLQNLPSIQPRTSPFKFALSPRTDPPGLQSNRRMKASQSSFSFQVIGFTFHRVAPPPSRDETSFSLFRWPRPPYRLRKNGNAGTRRRPRGGRSTCAWQSKNARTCPSRIRMRERATRSSSFVLFSLFFLSFFKGKSEKTRRLGRRIQHR